MQRQHVISELRRNADAVRSTGATSLYLFGSFATETAVRGSDIDLFIDYDASSRFSLIDLVGIKQFLDERMAAEVDITTRDSLHPLIRESIERSAYRVF